MKRNRDEKIGLRPQQSVPSQARIGVAGERTAERGILPVLEEQDDVLEGAAVNAARSMEREGRGFLEAAGAKMLLPHTLEEPSAQGA
jgi:hypothetical protein